jgi:hypothetical protein
VKNTNKGEKLSTFCRALAKNGSFGFLSVGSCVGKNQMCHLRVGFFTLTHNGLRLCVRAGFLPLPLIRRTELKYTQKASEEALNPA